MALSDGIIHLWNLDEASGNRADSVGSITLTEVSSVGSTTGKVGDAAQCDAANYLKADPASPGWAGLDNFSVAFWARTNAIGSGQQCILNWRESTQTLAWNFRFNNVSGILVLSVIDDAPATKTTTITAPTDSVWRHYALVYNRNDTMYVYADGSEANSVATDNQPMNSGASGIFYVGSRHGSDLLDADVDQVIAWNRAISAAEVGELYNSGAGLDPLASGATFHLLNRRRRR